jgi:hypothetical protein
VVEAVVVAIFPTECPECHSKVAVAGFLTWVHATWFSLLPLWILGFLAIYYGTWVPLYLFFLVWIAIAWAVVRFSPLTEIKKKKKK